MNQKKVNEKARQIAAMIDYAKEHYPLVAPILNSRLHLVKTKYGGVFLAAIAACQFLSVVLA